jgi:tetratricopeptide (TPR) repeat protein
LAVAVFAQSLSGGYVFDDTVAILTNPNAHWPPNIAAIFTEPYWGFRPGAELNSVYRPIVTLLFSLEHGAFGHNPLAARFVSLALHCLVTGLLWCLARVFWSGRVRPALAAALFAVLPVHVEAVVSAANRTELLHASLYIGALLVLASSLRAVGPMRRHVAGFCALMLMALCSKETAITLPGAAVALALLAPAPVRRARRAALVFGAPASLLVVAYLGWRWWVLPAPFGGTTPLSDNPLSRAEGMDRAVGVLAQLGTSVEVLLWPARLTADYTRAVLEPIGEWGEPAPWLGLAALTAGLVALGRVRKRPDLAWAAALFAVPYALVSNAVVGSTIHFAERLLYLPSAGVVLGAAALWPFPSRLLAAGAVSPGAARAAWALAALLAMAALVAGGVRAHRHALAWSSDEAIFAESLEARPGSARLHANLGRISMARGEWAAAGRHFDAALALDPDSAEAWLSRGNLQRARGALEAAAADYGRSAECLQGRFAPALVNRCLVYLELERTADAHADCERAVRLRPKEPKAWAYLGLAQRRLGRLSDAEESFRRALSLDPAEPAALNRLGELLRDQGRFEELMDTICRLWDDGPGAPELARELGHVARRAVGQAQARGDSAAAYRHALSARARVPGHAARSAELATLARAAGMSIAAVAWEVRGRLFVDASQVQ